MYSCHSPLAAPAAGRARAYVALTTDYGDLCYRPAALEHHRGNRASLGAAPERVGCILDIAADVQVATIVDECGAYGEA